MMQRVQWETLLFNHDILEESHVVPAFLTHERNPFKVIISICLKFYEGQLRKNIALATVMEIGIANAAEAETTLKVHVVGCWRHLKRI